MAEEVFKELRTQVDQINNQIDRAKTLISAMRDAGEDTSKLAQDLRSLEIRKNKWEEMLKARGY